MVLGGGGDLRGRTCRCFVLGRLGMNRGGGVGGGDAQPGAVVDGGELAAAAEGGEVRRGLAVLRRHRAGNGPQAAVDHVQQHVGARLPAAALRGAAGALRARAGQAQQVLPIGQRGVVAGAEHEPGGDGGGGGALGGRLDPGPHDHRRRRGAVDAERVPVPLGRCGAVRGVRGHDHGLGGEPAVGGVGLEDEVAGDHHLVALRLHARGGQRPRVAGGQGVLRRAGLAQPGGIHRDGLGAGHLLGGHRGRGRRRARGVLAAERSRQRIAGDEGGGERERPCGGGDDPSRAREPPGCPRRHRVPLLVVRAQNLPERHSTSRVTAMTAMPAMSE